VSPLTSGTFGKVAYVSFIQGNANVLNVVGFIVEFFRTG